MKKTLSHNAAAGLDVCLALQVVPKSISDNPAENPISEGGGGGGKSRISQSNLVLQAK
jgi:hypothetical protein